MKPEQILEKLKKIREDISCDGDGCNAWYIINELIEEIEKEMIDPSLCSKCQSASVSVEGSRCSDCI